MGNRTNIVLFGSMGVAVECLEWLLDQPDFRVLGVVCSREPPSVWRQAAGDRNMADAAPDLGVPIFTLDDAPPADLGLSVRFHEILRRRHLDRYRLGVVNLHGAPLPEMRGSYWEYVALAEGQSEFGASLHWIDKAIDSGNLIVCGRFPIAPTDVPLTLLERANRLGLELIKSHLADIAHGKMPGEPQVGGRCLTKASALELLHSRQVASQGRGDP